MLWWAVAATRAAWAGAAPSSLRRGLRFPSSPNSSAPEASQRSVQHLARILEKEDDLARKIVLKRAEARRRRVQRRRDLITIYATAFVSIFAGGAVVHRYYKPDLTLPTIELEEDEPDELDEEIEELERRVRQLERRAHTHPAAPTGSAPTPP